MSMDSFLDLYGKRINMLTAIRPVQFKICYYWLCKCDCGAEAIISASVLSYGKQQSCGCLRRVKKHEMYGSPTYTSWDSMIQRCTNPKSPGYEYYGGRGIKIFPPWMDFMKFHADMGTRPSVNYSIDRINSDGNYEPGNCRWATKQEQSSNRRANRFITAFGKTQTETEWSAELGIPSTTIVNRRKAGIPPELILSKENLKRGYLKSRSRGV